MQTTNPRRFRNDACFGSGHTGAEEVICHEIGELHNADIPDWCLKHYSLGATLRDRLEAVIHDIDDTCWDSDLEETVTELLDALTLETGTPVRHVLWLTDREAVQEYYDGDGNNVSEYPAGDVVLSDLGREGVLYGYAEKPEKTPSRTEDL